MANVLPAPGTLERMFMGVEKVKERLARAVAALEAHRVPYAVVGGNAVANWVTRIDPDAERFTRDVDIAVNRAELTTVIAALSTAGFNYAEVNGVHLFLDGPDGKPSGGVHLLFAGEKVSPSYLTAVPDLTESEPSPAFRVVSLEALVRMKLESNRDKDRTHVRDLIGVGLIDDSWPDRFPPPLSDRLRGILATPDG